MKDLEAMHVLAQGILDRANEEYRRGLETGTVMSVFLLAATARNMLAPEVAYLVLEWSDQGSFLTLAGAQDAEGQDLYEDFDDEVWETFNDEADTSFAWNLGENSESAWKPYVSGATRGDRFLLPVDAVIASIGKTL
jgi:hypothetical protein